VRVAKEALPGAAKVRVELRSTIGLRSIATEIPVMLVH